MPELTIPNGLIYWEGNVLRRCDSLRCAKMTFQAHWFAGLYEKYICPDCGHVEIIERPITQAEPNKVEGVQNGATETGM